MRKHLTSLSLMAFGAAASAQIVTDRPSFSDGTAIVPQGHWQIEVGYTNTSFRRSRVQTFGEALIRFPASDRFEVRLINLTYANADDVEGWQDGAIGFKYKLGNTGRAEWTLVGLSTVPSGNRAFRQDKWQPTVKIAGYMPIGGPYGVGWNLVGSSLADFEQYAASAYLSVTLSPKLSGFAEVYRVMPLAKDGPDGNFADAGLAYLLNPSTQVDFRVGTGFNARRDGQWFGLGISYRF